MCGASVQCVAIRVTELDAGGFPKAGNTMYVTDNLVKIDFNPEIETGQEISNKNAAGNLCVVFKTPDMMKRLNLSVDFCVPDPEFEVLVSGGDLFRAGDPETGDVQGFAYPPLMVDPVPNGVSIEAWSRYVVNGYQPPEQPYIWWVWPRAYLRKGNRTIDVNAMESHYEGFAGENPAWGTGPDGNWQWLSGRVLAAAYTDSIPDVQCGAMTVSEVAPIATGATAGTPGTFTPSGATPPSNLSGMSGITANPSTAWTTGQYVVLGDASHSHWDSADWIVGDAT